MGIAYSVLTLPDGPSTTSESTRNTFTAPSSSSTASHVDNHKETGVEADIVTDHEHEQEEEEEEEEEEIFSDAEESFESFGKSSATTTTTTTTSPSSSMWSLEYIVPDGYEFTFRCPVSETVGQGTEMPESTGPDVAELARWLANINMEVDVLDWGSRSSARFGSIDGVVMETVRGQANGEGGGEDEEEGQDNWYDADDDLSLSLDASPTEYTSCFQDRDSGSAWSCSFNSSLESVDIADQQLMDDDDFEQSSSRKVSRDDNSVASFVMGLSDEVEEEQDTGDMSTLESDVENPDSIISTWSTAGYTDDLPHWASVIPDDPSSAVCADITGEASTSPTLKSINARTGWQFDQLVPHRTADRADGRSLTDTTRPPSSATPTSFSRPPSRGETVSSSVTDLPNTLTSTLTSPASLTPFPVPSDRPSDTETSHHVTFDQVVVRYSGPLGAVEPIYASNLAAPPCQSVQSTNHSSPEPEGHAVSPPQQPTNPPLSPSPPTPVLAPLPPRPFPPHLIAGRPIPPPLTLTTLPTATTTPSPTPQVPTLLVTPPSPPPPPHLLTPEEAFRASYPGIRYNPISSVSHLYVAEDDRDMNLRQRRQAKVKAHFAEIKQTRRLSISLSSLIPVPIPMFSYANPALPDISITPPTPPLPGHRLTEEEAWRESHPGVRYNVVEDEGLLYVRENDRDMNSRQREDARTRARFEEVKRRRRIFQAALRPRVGPLQAIRRAHMDTEAWMDWIWE